MESDKLNALNAAIDRMASARGANKLAQQALAAAEERVQSTKIDLANAIQEMDHALFQLKSET